MPPVLTASMLRGGLSSRTGAYALAVLAAGATLAFRLALAPWFEDRSVLVLFVLPVLVSAYIGGFGPGFLCTVLVGLEAAYFVLPPTHSFIFSRPVDFAQWLILLLTGVLISLAQEEGRLARLRPTTEPRSAADPGLQRKVQAGFGIAIAALGLVGVVSFLAVVRLRENAQRVAHTHEVVGHIDALVAMTTGAESGFRGFAVSGEDVFAETYLDAAREVAAELEQLRTLIADNAGQLQRLETLARHIGAQLEFGREVIEARRRDFAASQVLILTHRGVKLNEQIRAVVEDMKKTESALLAEREARTARNAVLTQSVIVGGGASALALVGLALVAIRRDFAGRRQAEEALRRSENNLAVTLDSIGDGVLATDTAGRVTRMNRVAERFTGWTLAEALGRPVEEVFCIVNEDTRKPVPVPVAAVLATGQIQDLANHTVLIARDGASRAIADSAAPIRDGGGALLGVVLVFRDVTAERDAELKLAATNEELARERGRLKFIFDSLPIGISLMETNPAGVRKRLINEAHLRLCGLTREQVDEPHAFARISHPDDLPLQQRLNRAMDAGEIDHYAIDKRYLRPDGRVVWVMLTCQRRRHPGGGREDLSTVVDITQRKEAEAELERFFSLSLDFLCISSADGYFKRVSPAVTDILGWTTEEFIAQPYMDLVHPDDRTATAVQVQKQIAEGQKVLNFENRYRRKDGTWRTLSWRSVPQPGGLMYATARDVTERNRIDEEMLRLNAELQQRASELAIANKELESFSYSVSHDLRAPLRHVQGYVGMLLQEAGDTLSPTAQRYLKTIADSGRAMGQLIDDLLAFSKMGRTDLHEMPIDLTALAETVREELGRTAPERAIRWSIAALPPAQGDRAMIKQVFVNLLDNAVKYTRGRAPAEIAIGCAGEEDGRWVFYVRDNGAGFDMTYADKLFGVFQRLHRAEEFEGTGIGLANVRRIIHRHGGRTWAEGAVGAGATFYFTLRRAEIALA